MAKWMARSRGLLVKRLEVTQVPEEGQSTHQPVWSKVNLAAVLDMVEHLNDKTETSRVLLAEINKLKLDNERLREMAYGRPPGEFHRGGYIPREPIQVVPGRKIQRADEDRKTLASCRERFTDGPLLGVVPKRVRESGFPAINREPGVMVTINAPDASNGELVENLRRAIDLTVQRSIRENPLLAAKDHGQPRAMHSDTDNAFNLGVAIAAAGAAQIHQACMTPAESSSCDTPTNTDSSSPTPSE